MKKSFTAAAVCSALVLSLGLTTATAQEAISAADAEASDLYFVELEGNPVVDGNSVASVRAEKVRFMQAATRAGVRFQQQRSYEMLFNGYSVRANALDRARLSALPGVKAIWRVDVIDAPEFNPSSGAAPDLATAIAMTGANVVQNTLGYDGTGIRVAVMDTGIDYDHADFGGDGVTRSNSTVFPTSRVIAGWDFVGDAFTAGLTPVPDPFPDDCGGHGSHVAGIVGASGEVTGVAPGVQFGAYRVFGCDGSTTADIMLAAMERALADGMHVLNMSIGARAQHPDYPTGAAATRLLKAGMVVVASIGNNGPGGSVPDGPYGAGAPGIGKDVIGVASYDNTHVTQPAFSASPDGMLFGYSQASGSPAAPTSGSLPMGRTGTPASTADGCTASGPPAPGSLTGQAVLIRRGTCSFYEKSFNAQNAGAAAVVIYNNVAGIINPTVAGTPPITIPVVAVTAASGATLDGRIAAGATTLTWTDELANSPQTTGGLISGFSSFGLAADLSVKPDLGAPGGAIFSTIPLEQGGHGLNSGTSMSSPHVAGAVALLLQAKPGIPEKQKDKKDFNPRDVRDRLLNSATPTLWNGNPGLGFLDNVHRQGAGLLDIEAAILADIEISPGKLAVGESEAGPQTHRLKIRNFSKSPITFDLSAVSALATGPKSMTNFATVSYFIADSTVTFEETTITVPGRGLCEVKVTITAPTAPALGQYGGYIVLTPQGGGQSYSVPFAGFIGNYQDVPVLTPTANGFPWLAQLIGPSFFNRPTGATYTMVGDDVPYILVHLDHQSENLWLTVRSTDGTNYHQFVDDEAVGRNTTAGGFFALPFNGETFKERGRNKPPLMFTVPDGDYTITIDVVKANGSANHESDYESWTSPVFTIDRP